MEAAELVIMKAAASGQPFSADELWPLLPHCHERRVLGAAMSRAARAGMITPAGGFRPSSLTSSHACPRRLWKGMRAR
jgi:hypothetical protein